MAPGTKATEEWARCFGWLGREQKKSLHEARKPFPKTSLNQGPAGEGARATRVCFKSKPPDNFFFWVKNHKDSNLRICRTATPHLASVIRE